MRVVFAARLDLQQDLGRAIRAIVAVAISITQQAAVARTQKVRSVKEKTLGTRRRSIGELLERFRPPVAVCIGQNANVPGAGHDRTTLRVNRQAKGVVSQFVVGHLRNHETLGHGQSQRFVGAHRWPKHDEQSRGDEHETQHGRLRRT